MFGNQQVIACLGLFDGPLVAANEVGEDRRTRRDHRPFDSSPLLPGDEFVWGHGAAGLEPGAQVSVGIDVAHDLMFLRE